MTQETAGGKWLSMHVGHVLLRKGLIRQQCTVGLQLGLVLIRPAQSLVDVVLFPSHFMPSGCCLDG